ncbi:hypothetical protein ACFCWY_09005 [Streptomyces sp. NPDC056362]|uniref:hypothetical protein n=1 Tax=unclassified Streptomyces TaxID=2593676 RepID=UPI0035DA3C22
MTTYGFAIKALPPGAKPFGEEDDDENEEVTGSEEASLPEEELGDSDDETFEGAGEGLPDASAPGPPEPDTDAPPGAEGEEDPAVPPPPDDDSRPWAGDLYGEGDETDPGQAFAAYGGGDGEEAWLDKAPDGTLTGWVRDATSQIYRYTDADAWAIDVDGAQMTRTHGPEGDADTAGPPVPPGPAQDRGVQDDLFTSQ